MSYYDYLRDLLRPMRLYELDEGYGSIELEMEGIAFDALFEAVEISERESVLQKAESFGLRGFEELFPSFERAEDLNGRRETIRGLMRIDGHSHTLPALRGIVECFGIDMDIVESPGLDLVTISFPGVDGSPECFAQIRWLVEEILPCHLEVRYALTRTDWNALESRNFTWAIIESAALYWEQLEVLGA